jgi:aubergine-like protein
MMLCFDIIHKIINNTNVLETFKQGKQKAEQVLHDQVVFSSHTKRTEVIGKIRWDMSPKNTFVWNGEKVTFAEYFKRRYNLQVTKLDQPMLEVKNRTKDSSRQSFLVPELCKLTGFTDSM